MADAIPVVRFVLADPQNFREREVGQRGIARELNQALQAERARKIVRLFFRANIAPNQRRPNDISLFVKQNCAMHLAGEADAGEVFAGEVRTRKRFANRNAGGAPPVFGLLFRPANLRRCERLMIGRSGRNEPPALIDDDGARAAGANVNPEYVDKASSSASSKSQLRGDIIYSHAKMTTEGQSRNESAWGIAARPQQGKRKSAHLVGHEEERPHVEARILRTQPLRIVLLFDVDQFLRGGDRFQRNVVVVAVLEDD